MLWATAFFVSFIPAYLWWLIDPSLARFSSLPLAFTSIGQLSGLIGLSLFAFNVFLSARFTWFERFFGALNRIYIAHHIMGILVWILLIIHPLGLLFTYGISLLIPIYGNWSRNLGLASLLLFDALIITTLFVKLPYQIWRFTHKFLGIVLIMGAIHSLFVPSDISLFIPLKLYIFFLISVSVVAYSYRTLFGRKFVARSHYIVQALRTPLPGITEVTMVPLGKPLNFSPGQFIFVTCHYSSLTETHPFSICSSPTDPHLVFAAKAVGDYTSMLAKLPLGTPVSVEGPFGRFSYLSSSRPRQIWIAGGIGITPFLSMSKSLPTHGFNVDLYYSAPTSTQAAYLPDLLQLASANSSLKLIPCFSDITGRLTAVEIIRQSGQIDHADIFICGPAAMMSSLRKQFNSLGIRHSHIHTEEFSLN